MLCELLGLSAKDSSMSKGSLLERITHLKAAVSALMLDSSKENLEGVTSNGDLEDVEIVHSKTNGNSVHTMDLTEVEALEVKLIKSLETKSDINGSGKVD